MPDFTTTQTIWVAVAEVGQLHITCTSKSDYKDLTASKNSQIAVFWRGWVVLSMYKHVENINK